LFLVDTKELLVSSLSVYRCHEEEREFVYLDCAPLPPVFEERWPEERIAEWISEFGYAYEPLAWIGDRYITQEEWDDGYYRDGSKSCPVPPNTEVRRRFISEYGLFIAPKESVFNSIEFRRNSHTMALLRRDISLEKFVEEALWTLPKRYFDL
jgi:hypothetical protein